MHYVNKSVRKCGIGIWAPRFSCNLTFIEDKSRYWY